MLNRLANAIVLLMPCRCYLIARQVIFIGEKRGGCCATDAFFELMASPAWTVVGERELKHFEGVFMGKLESSVFARASLTAFCNRPSSPTYHCRAAGW